MEKPASARKEWIDFLRGIAMLLVIWGHIAKNEYGFFLVTSPFKIPMFFALTGYLFNDRNGDAKAFLKNLFFRIIIPWLVLSLVWARVGYSVVTGRFSNIWPQIYSVLSGDSFWFMPCCIAAECIQFLIRKFAKKEWVRYLVMAAAAAAGLVLTHFGFGSFALVDVACTAQLFMAFGLFFRNHEPVIREKSRPVWLWVLLAVYAGLSVLSYFAFPRQVIDVHHNDFYSLPVCFAMILISLFLLFAASPKLKRFPRWFLFVGQNTLVFYMLHYTFRTVFAKGLEILHVSLPKTEIGYLIEFVAVCVAMTVAALIINRFLPWAAGRRKKTV